MMTQDNLLILFTCMQKQLVFNFVLAFLDYQKGFNFVNRDMLFLKLFKSDLSGKNLTLLSWKVSIKQSKQ